MTDKNQRAAEWWANFGRLLDEQTEWPAPYLFKFIVPVEHMPAFTSRFEGVELQTRPSKNNNYIGVTMTPVMASVESVRAIYEKAFEVPGIIMF